MPTFKGADDSVVLVVGRADGGDGEREKVLNNNFDRRRRRSVGPEIIIYGSASPFVAVSIIARDRNFARNLSTGFPNKTLTRFRDLPPARNVPP